jgi:hypothetical protein
VLTGPADTPSGVLDPEPVPVPTSTGRWWRGTVARREWPRNDDGPPGAPAGRRASGSEPATTSLLPAARRGSRRRRTRPGAPRSAAAGPAGPAGTGHRRRCHGAPAGPGTVPAPSCLRRRGRPPAAPRCSARVWPAATGAGSCSVLSTGPRVRWATSLCAVPVEAPVAAAMSRSVAPCSSSAAARCRRAGARILRCRSSGSSVAQYASHVGWPSACQARPAYACASRSSASDRASRIRAVSRRASATDSTVTVGAALTAHPPRAAAG